MSMTLEGSHDLLYNDGSRTLRSKKLFLLIILVICVLVIGLLAGIIILATKPSSTFSQSSCNSPECYYHASALVKAIDNTANPCQNFYAYACGNLLKYDYLIGDTQMMENQFDIIETKIAWRIREILENPTDGSSAAALAKSRITYSSCMNESDYENINVANELLKSLGGWPLMLGDSWQPQSNDSESFAVLDELYSKLGLIREEGVLFSLTIAPDMQNTSQEMLIIYPGKTNFVSKRTGNQTEQVVDIVSAATTLNGSLEEQDLILAKEEAGKIITLNDELRKVREKFPTGPTELSYNKTTIATLLRIMPQVNWLSVLDSIFDGIKKWKEDDKIIILGANYLEEVGKLLNDIGNLNLTVRDIVNYEILKVILMFAGQFKFSKPSSTSAKTLTSLAFENEEEFENPRINSPRWRFCVQQMLSWYEFSLAKQYGDTFADVELIKQQAQEMSAGVFDEFQKRLQEIDWLDDGTRHIALQKLSRMKKHYLYPDWVANETAIDIYYKPLEPSPHHLQNVWNINQFRMSLALKNLLQIPNDVQNKRFAGNYPLQVNAFYSPAQNAMYILLGIAQTPLFSTERLKVMNYATLGSILGHEVTHGFDMTGQQYDEYGNKKSWIKSEVKTKMETKAQCFKNQYSSYELTPNDLPGNKLKVNGTNTVNENIADNGGLRHAFWAYRKWEKKNGPEILPEELSEFSNDQVFFIAYAHASCTKYSRSKQLVNIINKDVHSPFKFRIIGALSNFDQFSKAFSCKPNDYMNRHSNSCHIW